QRMATMSRKTIASAIRVPLTDSSPAGELVAASITDDLALLRAVADDEEEAQHQVDEIHRLDQADDQEHDHGETPLGLRLAVGALDGGVAGQPVPDGGADGAPAEGETGSNQRPGQDDRVSVYGGG